jgi:hypothetical protein
VYVCKRKGRPDKCNATLVLKTELGLKDSIKDYPPETKVEISIDHPNHSKDACNGLAPTRGHELEVFLKDHPKSTLLEIQTNLNSSLTFAEKSSPLWFVDEDAVRLARKKLIIKRHSNHELD